ncbi:peptidoglycan recognition protein family protein [Peribacillus saganii]|nr:peptidoglycan recognition family protein [Peribacillus saganii]
MKIDDIRKQTAGGASKRSLNQIKNIARHHSATSDGDYNAFWNNRWKGLGWKTGGYHELILRDGSVQLCYDPEVITNGIKGHNTNTYHICVVGNGSFTEAQEATFNERCKLAMKRFNLSADKVLGHKEFKGASTECPGIDMNIVRARLKDTPVKTASMDDGKRYRLFTGTFGTIADAEKAAAKIKKDYGYITYIREE